jgi:hypothetical protein
MSVRLARSRSSRVELRDGWHNPPAVGHAPIAITIKHHDVVKAHCPEHTGQVIDSINMINQSPGSGSEFQVVDGVKPHDGRERTNTTYCHATAVKKEPAIRQSLFESVEDLGPQRVLTIILFLSGQTPDGIDPTRRSSAIPAFGRSILARIGFG